MILSCQDIRALVQAGELLIEPFVDQEPQPRAHGRSYGLSSCGYDIRLAETVWVWPFFGKISVALEKIGLPSYLRARIENKSTNARLFIDASRVTNAEPGWVGNLTLEITRDRPWPVRLKAGTPIAQVVFELLTSPTERPYPPDGKYQNQPARPVPAILRD